MHNTQNRQKKMSIEIKKLGLIERLMQINEEEILLQYENLLKQAHLEYQAEKSITAIKEGETLSLNTFQEQSEKWLKKNSK